MAPTRILGFKEFERILEYRLHAGAQRPELPLGHLGDVLPVEPDRSRGDRQRPQHATSDRRLPGPALTDKGKGLAGPERKGDPIDCGQHLLPAPHGIML